MLLSIFCNTGHACETVAFGFLQNVKMTSIPVRQVIAERDPNRTRVIFEQTPRRLLQAHGPARRIRLPTIAQHINSVACDPHRTIPRCEDRIRVRTGQAFSEGITDNGSVAEHVHSTLGGHPQISLVVLVEIRDLMPGQTICWAVVVNDAIMDAVEP